MTPQHGATPPNGATSLLQLLRRNPSYRNTWMGQVVSEVGDYFNNVAVLALIMQKSGSGLIVSGAFLSRAIPAVIAGPFAGVILDRLDRRRIMIASDLVRAVLAAAFVFTIPQQSPLAALWPERRAHVRFSLLHGGTGGHSAHHRHPGRTACCELIDTDYAWATLTAGYAARRLWRGASRLHLGVRAERSLVCVLGLGDLAMPGARHPEFHPQAASRGKRSNGQDYRDGLAYMRRVPLTMGIAMISFGWALGGGAAQVLFALFGEQVFHRGPTGIGDIWGFAGIGLLIGGTAGHLIGKRAGFARYKRTVTVSYLLHGAAYMLFSQAGGFGAALVLMLLSRVGMAVTSVLNNAQLLRHTPSEFRGRVFATMESLRNAVMIVSMAAAGIASQYFSARTIGLIAGIFGFLTACAWAWCDWTGRLPEPVEPH